MGARDVGPWLGEPNPLHGRPQSKHDLPTYVSSISVDKFWTAAQHLGLTCGPIPYLNVRLLAAFVWWRRGPLSPAPD